MCYKCTKDKDHKIARINMNIVWEKIKGHGPCSVRIQNGKILVKTSNILLFKQILNNEQFEIKYEVYSELVPDPGTPK